MAVMYCLEAVKFRRANSVFVNGASLKQSLSKTAELASLFALAVGHVFFFFP